MQHTLIIKDNSDKYIYIKITEEQKNRYIKKHNEIQDNKFIFEIGKHVFTRAQFVAIESPDNEAVALPPAKQESGKISKEARRLAGQKNISYLEAIKIILKNENNKFKG